MNDFSTHSGDTPTGDETTDDIDVIINIPLGGDSYCETCGSSYNGVEFSYDNDGWYIGMFVGCYGGMSVSGKRPDALSDEQRERLTELLQRCKEYPMYDQHALQEALLAVGITDVTA